MNNSPQPCCSLCIPFFLPSSFSSSGHNQRMEFLGDSIMQLVATEYLFIHFPDHHEGHLTVRSNHKSSQGLLGHSASLHLCVVFIPSLCFCFLLLTQHEVTAVLLCLCVCVWVIFFFFFPFHPSHQSLNLRVPAQVLHSPPLLFLLCLFPQNNSLPLLTQHSACMFTVLRVMGIVMRQNCSAVFQ